MKAAGVILVAAVLLSGCETIDYFPGKVENPLTDWEVSGGDEAGGLPPRKRVYKDNLGDEAWPDSAEQREGKVTGTVYFGPVFRDGSGYGAANSRATTEFDCGAQVGDCVVKMDVNALRGTGSGRHARHERLVLTLEKLNDAGQPTGTRDEQAHPGNGRNETYTLRVPGCGKVRLTISFSETVNVENPAGIQTEFESRIDEYGCAGPG